MRAKTMNAVGQHAFGGSEVLRYEGARIPELKPAEALARAAHAHIQGKLILTARGEG